MKTTLVSSLNAKIKAPCSCQEYQSCLTLIAIDAFVILCLYYNAATSEFIDDHNQQNLALVGAQVLFKNYNKIRPTYGSCGESLCVV